MYGECALIFYKKLAGDLESHGFDINTYIPCVVNKTVDRKQLTITCHMENLKISHVDKKVVLGTILWLESVYGDMHVTTGKRHKYLGIWMDY